MGDFLRVHEKSKPKFDGPVSAESLVFSCLNTMGLQWTRCS